MRKILYAALILLVLAGCRRERPNIYHVDSYDAQRGEFVFSNQQVQKPGVMSLGAVPTFPASWGLKFTWIGPLSTFTFAMEIKSASNS